MKKIFYIFPSFVFAFGMVSFYKWNLNPFTWSETERMILSIIWTCIAVLAVVHKVIEES